MHPAPQFSRGYILLFSLVFFGIFLAISTAFLGSVTLYARAERVTVADARARALAEAGFEKAVYELNKNSAYTGEANTALGGGTFTTSVTNIDASTKRITATGAHSGSTAVVRASVSISNEVVSFNYGVQVGQGGLTLSNSSRVNGNVHSAGSILMTNSSSINGTAISSGAAGLIDGAESTVTGSAYAHTMRDVDVGADAYYVTQSNVEAGGSNCPNSRCHPNSPDQPTVPLPISDAQISEWEADAEAGGTIVTCDGAGNYVVNTSLTLGPKKIACNLVLSGSATITIAGPVWVVGNITTSNSVSVRMASELGSENVAIIADDPSNPTTKGIVSIGSSGQFYGSGSPGSYVFIISQNRSAEAGGATTAISMSQSANALVLYASHGRISLSNSVSIKAATGYRLALANSASVTYESGLADAAFQSGPGGSWTFVPGSYALTD